MCVQPGTAGYIDRKVALGQCSLRTHFIRVTCRGLGLRVAEITIIEW